MKTNPLNNENRVAQMQLDKAEMPSEHNTHNVNSSRYSEPDTPGTPRQTDSIPGNQTDQPSVAMTVDQATNPTKLTDI